MSRTEHASLRGWKARWHAWVDRRIPRTAGITLGHRNLFVFLTDTGLGCALVLLLLFLVGVNYENPPILAIAFFMVAVMVASILLTFEQLSGLRIDCIGAGSGFVGDIVVLNLQVDGRGKRREHILFRLAEDTVICTVYADAVTDVRIPFAIGRRGKNLPPRIRVETRFPFGWIVCWTWVAFDRAALGWPTPRPFNADNAGQGGSNACNQTVKGDDPTDLRPYRPGDVLARVAWKASAGPSGWYTRDMDRVALNLQHFQVDVVSRLSLEQRLGEASGWLCSLDTEHDVWSLGIGGDILGPSSGVMFFHACLDALALTGEA